MSLEAAKALPEPNIAVVGTPPEATTEADDYAKFSAAYDRITAEPERDETGRFKAKEAPPEPAADTEAKPSDKVAEALTEEAPKAEAKPPRSLPANWTPDMADILDGMDEAKASKLTAWSERLHREMSDMGRERAVARQFTEVVSRFPQYFGANGVNPAEGFSALIQAQARLDADPVEGITWLMDRYGVKDRFIASQDGGLPASLTPEVLELRQTIAGLREQLSAIASPDAVQRQIQSELQRVSAEDTVNRWAQSKPFYAEVEADLPHFIQKAKQAQPDGKPEAWLEAAYDMAVHANPALRSKVTKAAEPVADLSGKREAEAKRAASINVTSTASGKPAVLTETQEMDRVWKKHYG